MSEAHPREARAALYPPRVQGPKPRRRRRRSRERRQKQRLSLKMIKDALSIALTCCKEIASSKMMLRNAHIRIIRSIDLGDRQRVRVVLQLYPMWKVRDNPTDVIGKFPQWTSLSTPSGTVTVMRMAGEFPEWTLQTSFKQFRYGGGHPLSHPSVYVLPLLFQLIRDVLHAWKS